MLFYFLVFIRLLNFPRTILIAVFTITWLYTEKHLLISATASGHLGLSVENAGPNLQVS